MELVRKPWGVLALGIALCGVAAAPAAAQTLEAALVQAYLNNPSLNSQRAAVRATDENVAQALAGYNSPVQAGITATETLFNGFQTANRTRQAESQVLAARETLRNSEQSVLLNAATAYMNLLRDTAILDLQRRNVEVLQEQLRQTRDRFNVGEVTRTDVAQAESRLAAGRSQVLTAESNYVSSKAVYRQTVGVEPGKLSPATPVDRLSPRTLNEAIAAGRAFNPNVAAAMFGIDVAELAVKISEGALYPNLTLQGSVQQNNESSLLGLKSL